MATRVLNTIKEKDTLIGFRVICSLQNNRGIHILSLDKARKWYKTVEPFENVRYVGNGRWEGVECGLDKLPTQDKAGQFVKCKEHLFVLGKMYENRPENIVGYKLMDLNGDVFYLPVMEACVLGAKEGFINVKLVIKDKKPTISAIRGQIHSFRIKLDIKGQKDLIKNDIEIIEKMKKNKDIKSLKDMKSLIDYKKPSTDRMIKSPEEQLKSPLDIIKTPIDMINPSIDKLNNIVDNRKDKDVMDDKEKLNRYLCLAILFGKKSEGSCSDSDIAKEIGAKVNSEVSEKIHEYLGEPLSVSDSDILKKLHSIYKSYIEHKKKQEKNQHFVDLDSAISYDKGKTPEIQRMQELIDELTPAAEAYYTGADEIMSNYEYDKKYNELEELEKKTGVVLANSLTQRVGFEVKSKLQKVRHSSKMLSLDKTKDRQELANSLGGQEGFLGWKLDGLTVVLVYEGGKLQSAVTRGDGTTGEDITHNAKFFLGVPQKINYKDRLVVRGEALISYKTFNAINAKITNIDDKYKNPRNLASGSVRQLDSKIAKERNIHVIAFTVVEGFDSLPNYTDKLEEIRKLGFDVVPYVKVNKDTTVAEIEKFEKMVKSYQYPTDGLVITIDNIAYGEMLGTTSKFPRNSKAFKWKDEESETEAIDIDWSASRTGAINPVAVFKPVDIDGTTVRRASLHNVSVMRNLLGEHPYVGQKLWVIKSNMIIPTVVRAEKLDANFSNNKKYLTIPEKCPVCGQPTQIAKAQDAEVLMCTNPDCLAKHIGGLAHFTTRDALNIDGLSEATLETLVNEGFIHTFKDLYHISDYEEKIIKLDGWGKSSYLKMYKAIEKSRNCELPAFLYGLGIDLIGKTASKIICRAFDYDLEKIMGLTEQELLGIDGVGEKAAKSLVEYFKKNADMVRELAKEMTFKAMPKIDRNSPISGKTFCITGDVYTFKNRKELQAKIESLGAKAASSVSSKTDYLINNDTTSGSNKNQTAKKLGIPIISEADFLKMIGE